MLITIYSHNGLAAGCAVRHFSSFSPLSPLSLRLRHLLPAQRGWQAVSRVARHVKDRPTSVEAV